MSRALFEELMLFLIPFAAFALYLAVRRRNPLTREPWRGHVPWLALVGLGFAIGSLVLTGLLEPRRSGSYVPPHVENGKLVPGQFQ
ncbi:DUF6111 family protein [Chelatococcus reniformis]|uniref:Uncharacterized protein n=1 Tax=Chelatococcus reniformis TaxID=1494448 RepID=A0A916XL88_9HYPH|nr:DUF6111 family protein [Chelatococcus reniformis]GGC80638.1 hypothetical protein GCM10010994_43290 [Chelatococcus reniformis]